MSAKRGCDCCTAQWLFPDRIKNGLTTVGRAQHRTENNQGRVHRLYRYMIGRRSLLKTGSVEFQHQADLREMLSVPDLMVARFAL